VPGLELRVEAPSLTRLARSKTISKMMKFTPKKGFSHLSTTDTGHASNDIEMQNTFPLSSEISEVIVPHGAVGEELQSDEDDSENRPMLKSGSGPSQGCMKSCLSSTQIMSNACNNGVKRLLGWKREPSYQARSIPLSGGVKLKTYLSTRGKADPALLQALSIPNVVRNQKYHAATFVFQVIL
jgi:hypothetical protein